MSQLEQKESLFKLPNYPAWFGSDTLLLCSSAVHWIVISMMAYQLSGSVTMAGWFSTARAITSVITQIIGGTFVDRHDHRRLLLIQSGSCGLLWLTMGVLFATGHLTFTLFMVLCLSSSAIFGLLDGTSNAALITVVGPDRYAEAESLNQGRDAAVRMGGSPLGAALFGLWGAAPFFASALCDGLAFICSYMLHLPERPEVKEAQLGLASFLGDLVEGWRWVLASKTIVSAVLIMSVFEFGAFSMHQAINLQLVSSGTDAVLISLINVIAGIATFAGSIISARICDHVVVGKGVAAILILTGIGYVPLVFSSTYATIALSTVLTSLPMPLFSALANGFVFSKTPVDRQGRTRAAVMTTIMLFGSASGAFAGELLPRIGFSGVSLVILALVAISVLLVVLNPRIRAIPASPEWKSVDL